MRVTSTCPIREVSTWPSYHQPAFWTAGGDGHQTSNTVQARYHDSLPPHLLHIARRWLRQNPGLAVHLAATEYKYLGDITSFQSALHDTGRVGFIMSKPEMGNV